MCAPDSLLIQRSRAGDLDAFEELVKRYEGKVYTVAYRYSGHHEDAKDILQNVFLRVYHSLASFRGDSSFSTWLFRITVNACCDELRKKRNRHNSVPLEESLSITGNYPLRSNIEKSPKELMEKEELRDKGEPGIVGVALSGYFQMKHQNYPPAI